MNWLDKFIVSERGQWDHPGKPTAVPTKDGRITMEGVPYPVMGFVPGQPPVIMQPGGKYQFPGKMVYEVPMAYGGDISIPDLSRPNWLDKAQKGQQVKYYDDPIEFAKANQAYNDSLTVYNAPKTSYDRHTEIKDAINNSDFQKAHDLLAKPYPSYNAFRRLTILNNQQPKPISGYPIYLGFNPSDPLVPKFKKPTQKPVYKEKPKEYIPTKTVKLEREPIQLVIPQSDRTLDNYNNTLQVLRAKQKEDRSNKNLYPTRVVPAPDFRHGGWLEQYQDGSEVTYQGPQLNQVTVQGEKPSWVKDKEGKTPDDINWYETLNFKKWGLKDYSDYSSFNSAFRNARESGEKEFVWNDKRYNTDLIPKATSDKYWDAKRFLQDYYTNEPFTPLDTSSITLHDFYDDYTKKKYGYTWLDYFDKIKNTPQYLDPKSEEDQNTYDKYQDTLRLLDKPNFYSEYSNEAKAALKDRAKNKYIEALNDPSYYFSITSKPDPKNPTLGYVDGREGKNKIYVSDKGNTNDFTTFVHELSHKGDSKSRIDYYGSNSRIPDVDVDAINKFGTGLTQDRFDYVSDPSETEARKMSTLYFMDRVLNKDIKSGKITENDLKELYDTYHKEGGYGSAKSLPDDIQDLLELYKWQQGDLLKYLNNDFNYRKISKRYGGSAKWLDQFQGDEGSSQVSKSLVDPETGVVTNINITDEPPFQWTPLEDQYGINPSAQKRSDYVPYKDVSGSPYETQDPYIHNFSTVDVPENLSELPSYRMYTYGKNQIYNPFSGHISRAKPNAKPINEYGDIGSEDLEDQPLYDQYPYRTTFDPKTGYNYELNKENLQPFQSIPMEGDKGFNLRRFVLNPYEGDPQTHDVYIKEDGTVDKENFIPTSYSREETMDNVFKDLYGQNLYKFKGDRDAAYNATSDFIKDRVEPQYKGKYYEYMNNPNVSEQDKNIVNPLRTHMTVNPEQSEDYVRQTIADKLAEEHPEYMEKDESGNYKMSDDDFSNLVKADPRYKEKLNEYNDVLQDWYVTNKNMSQEEAKGLVEKDLYKNVPKRKTTYATFKNGGWLDVYQDGSQVKANIPGYNPEVGPTVKNAELLKQLEMQEAVRNSQSLNLPSGAIQSTLGPIEYAMLPGLAAPVIKAAMAPKAPADPELEAIRKILRKNVTHIKQTRPLTETPPWPNRFLELGDDAWVIGNAERGRTSVENPDILLPGNLPKRTPKQLPGVNGTQYPNRLPKQKNGGWLDNY